MNEQVMQAMEDNLAQMQAQLNRAKQEKEQERQGIVVTLMVDGNSVDARMSRNMAEGLVKMFESFPSN